MSQEHKFLIHKDFICYHSPFFAAAFNGPFQEGTTQTMKLEDVEANVFGILVDWVYTQEVADKSKKLDLATYAKLWILADRFLMRRMQNDVMKKVHELLTNSFGDAYGFRDFARIAGEFKRDFNDNPLARIAALKLVWGTQSFFNLFIGSAPQSILLPVVRALKDSQEALTNGKRAKWEPDVKNFLVEEDVTDGKQ